MVVEQRRPPESVEVNDQHPEGVQAFRREVWHPFRVRSLLTGTGGLRCATTTGYFLATLQVALKRRFIDDVTLDFG